MVFQPPSCWAADGHGAFRGGRQGTHGQAKAGRGHLPDQGHIYSLNPLKMVILTIVNDTYIYSGYINVVIYIYMDGLVLESEVPPASALD